MIRRVGGRQVHSGDELVRAVLKEMDLAITVPFDATPDVPWRDYVRTLALCKNRRIEWIEISRSREFED